MDRELLFHLAEDAFEVLNWARRLGLKKDKQLEQCVEAFQKTLADSAEKLGALPSVGMSQHPHADGNLQK